MYNEVERHTDCTVIILEDDETHEVEILWYKNSKPPKMIYTDLEDE